MSVARLARGVPAAVAAAALGLVLLLPTSAGASPGLVSPADMRGLGAATQVLVVQAGSMRSTFATATAYQRKGAGWVRVRGPMSARLGYRGLSLPTRRVMGDETTPMGVYRFVYDFGSQPDPGVEGYSWRHLVPGSCWTGTRHDYNRWVHQVPCNPADEDLWSSEALAYRYAAVISYNYYHPVYPRGSGIFLHVGTGTPTAGCVSLHEDQLLAVLRWLRPNARIVIGTRGYLRALR